MAGRALVAAEEQPGPEEGQALAQLDPASLVPSADFPLVLSAGQRRLQNANQILRDPAFRQRDPDGALTVHPQDLATLGAADGQWLAVVSARGRLVARAKADETLRPGHVVLPHGYGQAHPDAQGRRQVQGPRVNELTDSAWCDPVAGTPYSSPADNPYVGRAGRDEALAAECGRRNSAGPGRRPRPLRSGHLHDQPPRQNRQRDRRTVRRRRALGAPLPIPTRRCRVRR